jgi:hypothetical protein
VFRSPGLLLDRAQRSVKENGTSTMSPCLKRIVDGIFGIVPEFERGLSRFEPRNVVGLNFQMRRQILKQPDLLTHIQMFNRFADFVDRAHHPFINRPKAGPSQISHKNKSIQPQFL